MSTTVCVCFFFYCYVFGRRPEFELQTLTLAVYFKTYFIRQPSVKLKWVCVYHIIMYSIRSYVTVKHCSLYARDPIRHTFNRRRQCVKCIFGSPRLLKINYTENQEMTTTTVHRLDGGNLSSESERHPPEVVGRTDHSQTREKNAHVVQ